jgi:hypothetical protein
MMAGDVEALLRQALAPVDPPVELEERLERTLGSLVELAAEELEAWELSAMRDPRNWPRQALRPAAAVVVGSAAAVGLVAVRTQRKRHRRRAVSGSMLELAERTLRDVATEARRLADEAPGRR